MRGDIMPAVLEISDDFCKGRVPEKITGEKKRGLNFFFFESLVNKIPAVREFMTGKDQRDILP